MDTSKNSLETLNDAALNSSTISNTHKKIFLSDLNIKDPIKELFLIKLLQLTQGRDGRDYLNCILVDQTGEMEARVWGGKAKYYSQNFIKGEVCLVEGKINLYQGRKQFIIQEIHKVDQSKIDFSLFQISSDINAQELFNSLNEIVKSLDDFYIRELLTKIIHHESIKPKLLTWPAGKSIHHAYQSGLLEHILSCAQLAQHLGKFYKVNSNYVVAGAILHDLAKIEELTFSTLTEYSDEGKLVGHLINSVELIEKFSLTINNFPSDLKMHLKHIVVSHHGSYEFGSPKLPQTAEANLVHLIDYMDSKMNAIETIIKTDSNVGDWSNFNKYLDRTIYKIELPFYPNEILNSPSHVNQSAPNGKSATTLSNSQTPNTSAKKSASTKEKDIKESLAKHLQGFKLQKDPENSDKAD
jgi:3'-5' exoribonuclease